MPFLLAFLSLLASVAPAAAQTRIVVSSSGIFVSTPSRIFAYELETGRTLWSSGDGGGVVAQTSDGRYAVDAVPDPNAVGGVLRVFDQATGAVQLVDLGRGVITALLAHPRLPVIFVQHGNDIVSVEAGRVRRLLSGCRDFDLSLDGRLLVARCDSASVVVADAASGALVRRVAVPESAGSFRINGDASRLVAANREISLYDLNSGALLRTASAPIV